MEPDLLVLDEPTRGVDGLRKAARSSSSCGRWRRRARPSWSSPTTWTSPPRRRTSSRAWRPGRVLADRAPARPRSPRGIFFVSQLGLALGLRVARRRRRAAHRAPAGGPCLATPSRSRCSPRSRSALWRSRPAEHRSRELALIAALAAAAAGGRVLFAAIPNVQPVTMIVAVTGVTLGARAGLATGAAAALASNAFLGQGPWTPWQMTGWGTGRRDRGHGRAAAPQPRSAWRCSASPGGSSSTG